MHSGLIYVFAYLYHVTNWCIHVVVWVIVAVSGVALASFLLGHSVHIQKVIDVIVKVSIWGMMAGAAGYFVRIWWVTEPKPWLELADKKNALRIWMQRAQAPIRYYKRSTS